MRSQGGREFVEAAEAGDEKAKKRVKEIKEIKRTNGKKGAKKGAKKKREDAAGTPPPYTRTPDCPKWLRPLPPCCSRGSATRLGQHPTAERWGC